MKNRTVITWFEVFAAARQKVSMDHISSQAGTQTDGRSWVRIICDGTWPRTYPTVQAVSMRLSWFPLIWRSSFMPLT